MIISTPAGPIEVTDSIRTLRADRYLLFHQAWAMQVGVGSDMYAAEGHFARTGVLLAQNLVAEALVSHNNAVLALTNLTAPVPVHYLAAVLAPLVVSIAGVPRQDFGEQGLADTAVAVLATGLTQAQLEEAVTESKKNFRPN